MHAFDRQTDRQTERSNNVCCIASQAEQTMGERVMGMGQQMWMGHVGHGLVPQTTWPMIGEV